MELILLCSDMSLLMTLITITITTTIISCHCAIGEMSSNHCEPARNTRQAAVLIELSQFLALPNGLLNDLNTIMQDLKSESRRRDNTNHKTFFLHLCYNEIEIGYLFVEEKKAKTTR
ncbi:hypothetical protein GQX74_014471 [Glossina fuscipes]|nr:hypothetical protein GQX74_014471 [Glossina fuscipes]